MGRLSCCWRDRVSPHIYLSKLAPLIIRYLLLLGELAQNIFKTNTLGMSLKSILGHFRNIFSQRLAYFLPI